MTTGPSGPTGPAPIQLPPPPAGAGAHWKSAYAQYLANPIAGYAAYYNFMAGGDAQHKAALAGGNFPAPGTSGAPDFGLSGGGTGATGAPAPQSNVPLHNNDPNVLGLYNRDPNWLSNFITPGTAFGATGAPPPAPAPTGPAPTGGTGASGPLHGGSGPGGTGNEGGASHGVGGGGAGDNAGHPGSPGGPGGSTAQANALLGDNDLINLGPWGASLLGTGAILAPGMYGAGLSAAQLLGRGINTSMVDQIRQQQGLPPLDWGQIAGSMSALNQYGNLGGGNTIADPGTLAGRLQGQPNASGMLGYAGGVPAYNLANELFGQFGAPAETQGGSDYQQGPGGVLGWIARNLGLVDDTTSRALDINAVNHLTNPGAMDSDIAALWNGADGTTTNNNAANNVPPGYVQYTGSLKEAPAGLIRKDGVNYAPDPRAGGMGINNGMGNLGNNANQIHNNTFAGNQVDKSQSFDVASGTWGAPGGTSNIGAGGSLSSGSDMGSNTRGGYAQGGTIRKPVNRLMGGDIPGDPRQGDTVPIRATPGEFMVNHDAAQNLGPNLLHALNNPLISKWLGDQMGGFAKATPEAQPEEPAVPQGPHGRYGDPHLPDAFIDAIMHAQHAPRLDALLKGGWNRSWA